MSFAIFTDTSANIPSPVLARYDLGCIPFSFFYNGEEHTSLDTESFDYNGYYEMISKGVDVTTSQINPQRFVDNFEPVLKEGRDILFVSMSSGISSSFNSSTIAAAQLKEAYPERTILLIDTYGASLGEGLLAMRASDCRAKGMTLQETYDYIIALRDRFYQVFTVDNLMHLRRSGRISNITAVVGTVLNIKPLLKGDETGHIVSFSKVRGRKSSIEALAEKYNSYAVNPCEQIVGIAHAGCLEDAEYLAKLLKEKNPPKEILLVDYEPVTGSHVGPGALALFFESFEGVRLK